MLDLPTAAREIVQATTRQRGRGRNTPFFFIVGAGISAPCIPLASAIERLCRDEIARQGLPAPSEGGKPMDRYEASFRLAFPQAEERRAFLHDRIHRAPISPANFRLAHLLGSGKLTNLVFTPNFDEMLARALRLFGHDVVVCDHPRTTQRIDPTQVEALQIVHVHGTHWFYDCCNLKGEIESQAQRVHTDNTSMGQLLDRVLHDRAPIVVGYSGWEGDVLMTALKRRLLLPMPYNLYWFCFSDADANALPPWLREDPNVRLVVPSAAVAKEAREGELGAGQGPMRVGPSTVDGADGSVRESVLSACQAFEALIQKLDLQAPELTINPLEFFARHLEKNLMIDGENDGEDIYLIREVIERVKAGVRLEGERRGQAEQEQRETAERLSGVNDAVRRSAYHEAVELARGIKLESLSEAQRVELEAALEGAYLGVVESDASIGLEACETRSRVASLALASNAASQEWALRMGKAIHGKGFSLGMLGRSQEAIAAYDAVIARFNDATDSSAQERLACALLNKGVALGQERDAAEEIATYDDVLARFGTATEPALREQVAKAIVNKGIVLGIEGKSAEAIATCDDVVARFGTATEPALRDQVAKAMVNKGMVFGDEGKSVEAIAIYDDVVARFGTSPEPRARHFVAAALLNKGIQLANGGRGAEAIAAYDELVARFGTSSEPVLQKLVARALTSKRRAGQPDSDTTRPPT